MLLPLIWPSLHAFLASFLVSVECATITGTTLQTIDGIGASGAWWVNDIANFPASVRQNLSDLLLSPSKLGLSNYRYNLGGGGVGVTTPDRAPETPYVSDGVYNFSKDAAGTFFLQEAARHGVAQLTLFVNSAPSTMTSNGQSCGGTLITSRIPAYAQYIADVVSHWDAQGVKITHVSTMNEPDNTFGGCGQEGMEVTPSQRAQLILTTAKALNAAGLSTMVIGDETSQVSLFESEAPTWLNTTVGVSLAGVAHHQYAFASGQAQRTMAQLALNLSGGTPSWSTEICCFVAADSGQAGSPLAAMTYGGTYDPTIVGGLRMAVLIFQSLGDAQEPHWDFWTAVSNAIGSCDPSSGTSCLSKTNADGWNDGLIYYDPNFATTGFTSLFLSKRYHVLKHFTKSALVGSVVRRTSLATTGTEANWRVLAFNTPGARTLHAIVAMNGGTTASTLTITGSGFTLPVPKSVVRTSASEDYVTITTPTLGNGSLAINAPALSIYTIFF
ncbi:glycoside hydrolase [Vararia minispora EC-137]|uniref:Glycoside hydrolase n=1 Tax=Vararia minispora EC-137 TaxID=1314806 RepID=A0ACB8QL56_9AGAM|nr:glycoside hydrolase [Vararia minispora EC-137]